MCGIAGALHPGGLLPERAQLESALLRMAHRGPDGQSVDAGHTWCLGHRRLAVFDTSVRGAQPMQRGDCTIVFNGAIYNFPEIKAELVALGHIFVTQTDTEVLLAAYQQWGEACVQRFNGMWAFVIVDAGRQRAFGSRDRFGIKPFYYTLRDGGMVFASEIKGVRAIAPTDTLHPTRTWEYLAYGWQDHTTDTLFADIRQLPPAHRFTYCLRTGLLEIDAYYHTPTATLRASDISMAEAVAGVRQHLARSVALRTRTDVPWGITLSGGLDSSSIAGLLRQQLGPDAPIRAFAAVYDEPGISERPYLEAVVRQHHLQADVLAPDWNHFTANISDVLDKQDEPISATAVVGYRALMQAARAAGVKVILNGQGADEVLGGYDKFFAPYLRELRRTDPAQLPSALWHIWRRGQFDATDALRRGLAYRRAAPLPWMASPTLPPDGYRRPPDTDMLHCSHNLLGGVGFPVLLHYEDRNAMAEGIESRLPFLDVDFVNFVLPLPAAYKIHGGWRKHLLRTAMADVLPDVVRYRSKKLGFATPQHRWMDAHPALFTDWVAQACRRYPEYLSPAAVAWSQQVLLSRNYPAYNTVWRIGIFGMMSC